MKAKAISTKRNVFTDVNGEWLPLSVRTHQKELLKAQLQLKTIKKVILTMICLAAMIYVGLIVSKSVKYITAMQNNVVALQDQVSTLKEYQKMYVDVTNKNAELSEQNKELQEVSSNLITVKEELKTMASQNNSIIKENDQLKKDIGLCDKYKYALYDTEGNRTDLTLDQVKLGVKLMEEKGYNPHILFAIGMVESNYTEDCSSSLSTAKGYHQFLDGTAIFTYETLLKHGKGSWSPSKSLDGETNIRMCVAYFDYLMKNKHGDFYSAIGQYCGAGTSPGSFTYEYIKRMDSYTKQSGVSIYNIV